MSAFMKLSATALLALAGAGFSIAQSQQTDSNCDDSWRGGNRSAVNICEVREFTLDADGSLQISGSPNGSVKVTGWDRDDIQVRAEVRAWARDESQARARLNEVEIETEGSIRARGPETQNSWRLFGRRNNGGWNVSFEVMAPHETDLWIETVNGRITVAGVQGSVDAETVNGGINVSDISSTLRGRTVNGGINAELAGNTLEGDVLDLRTTNGGIVMRIPEEFSARLDVRTVNGGVRSDFPVIRQGRRNREVTGVLGDGGPLIRARTVNGGVRIDEF